MDASALNSTAVVTYRQRQHRLHRRRRDFPALGQGELFKARQGQGPPGETSLSHSVCR